MEHYDLEAQRPVSPPFFSWGNPDLKRNVKIAAATAATAFTLLSATYLSSLDEEGGMPDLSGSKPRMMFTLASAILAQYFLF